MITYEDIIQHSKQHPVYPDGKCITLENENQIVSIVGGCVGLYGDFIHNFEVAVIDKKTRNFVTKYFFHNQSDDIIPFMEEQKLLEFLNGDSSGFRIP